MIRSFFTILWLLNEMLLSDLLKIDACLLIQAFRRRRMKLTCLQRSFYTSSIVENFFYTLVCVNRDLKKIIQRILTKFGTFGPNCPYILLVHFHTISLKTVGTTLTSFGVSIFLKQGV